MKNILFVTTNYSGCDCSDRICGCIKETGVHLEEYAVPYLIFEATGYKITTASPKGGLSPVDESSMSCSNPQEWDRCIKILRETKKLSELDFCQYDAIYFPGGHGPMFDIANDEDVKSAVEDFYFRQKPIAAICHGVVALINAKDKNQNPIVKNRKITSFTNKEETIVKLQEYVPFSLEDKLRELGADFIEEKPWQEHVETDGNIITGQNQNSATLLAEKLIEKLN